MRPTLRDCPFCHADGANDEKVVFFKNVAVCHDTEYAANYSVFCTECGATVSDEYEDEVVNRWNGVKPEPEPEGGDE